VRRKARNPAQRLALAVAALPRRTRIAMLRGIDGNEIIAGGYSDKRAGGICPMLAAHRNGGRTSLASFARAWDRFTGAERPRLATDRELRALRSHLELSLLEDEQPDSLRALSERIKRDRRERPARATKPRRHTRLGAWLIPARRYDVFADRLAAAHEQVSEQRAAQLLTRRDRRAASSRAG
jgi:hypothetical protein